jgi:hypothetical protein
MSTTREQVDVKDAHRNCTSDDHRAVMAAQTRNQQRADIGWDNQKDTKQETKTKSR